MFSTSKKQTWNPLRNGAYNLRSCQSLFGLIIWRPLSKLNRVLMTSLWQKSPKEMVKEHTQLLFLYRIRRVDTSMDLLFFFHYSLFWEFSQTPKSVFFSCQLFPSQLCFCVLGGALSSTHQRLLPHLPCPARTRWSKELTIWGVTKVRGILLEVWDAHHCCETCLLFFLLDLLKMLGKSKVFC